MKLCALPLKRRRVAQVSVSDREGDRWPAWRACGEQKNRRDRKQQAAAWRRNGHKPEGRCFKGRDGHAVGRSAERAGRPCENAVIVAVMLRRATALLRHVLPANGLREIALQRVRCRNAQRGQQGHEHGEQQRRSDCARDTAPLRPHRMKPSSAHDALLKPSRQTVEVAKGRMTTVQRASTISAAVT